MASEMMHLMEMKKKIDYLLVQLTKEKEEQEKEKEELEKEKEEQEKEKEEQEKEKEEKDDVTHDSEDAKLVRMMTSEDDEGEYDCGCYYKYIAKLDRFQDENGRRTTASYLLYKKDEDGDLCEYYVCMDCVMDWKEQGAREEDELSDDDLHNMYG